MSDSEDSYLLAIDQYLYWREQGFSHADMLMAIGVTPPPMEVEAEFVIRYLTHAHKELRIKDDPGFHRNPKGHDARTKTQRRHLPPQ